MKKKRCLQKKKNCNSHQKHCEDISDHIRRFKTIKNYRKAKNGMALKYASYTKLCFCRCTLRVSSAPCKGPISRDYEREFPSVEVGPGLMVRRSRPGHTSLASVRMDSDVSNHLLLYLDT